MSDHTPLLAPVLEEREGWRAITCEIDDYVIVHSAMDPAKPDELQFPYSRLMLAGLLYMPLRSVRMARTTLLGLGGGTLARFTANVLKQTTTAVEVDPEMIALAKSAFGLPAAVHVVNGDGLQWVSRPQAEGSIDLLQVDTFAHGDGRPALDSVSFYAACRRALAPGGVMAINVGALRFDPTGSIDRIATLFGPRRVRVFVQRPVQAYSTAVVLALKCTTPPPESLLRRRAQALERRFGPAGLSAAEWMEALLPGLTLPPWRFD